MLGRNDLCCSSLGTDPTGWGGRRGEPTRRQNFFFFFKKRHGGGYGRPYAVIFKNQIVPAYRTAGMLLYLLKKIASCEQFNDNDLN